MDKRQTTQKFNDNFLEPLADGFSEFLVEARDKQDFTTLALFESFLNMLTYEERAEALKQIFIEGKLKKE